MGSIEDSSGVPQVWQRRSEGSGTSHNAFSGKLLGGRQRLFHSYSRSLVCRRTGEGSWSHRRTWSIAWRTW